MSNIKLIGAVGIKVRPDTSDFKRELKEDLKNLADHDLEVNVDADTSKARKKIEKERAEQEAKTLTLQVGLDYDSARRGLAKVDSMLKALDAKPIEITLDRPGLEKAQREIAALAKQAKVEFKFTQDEQGYRSVLNKIASIRRQKAEKEVTFATDYKSLRKMEAEAKAALKRIDANKKIEIRYGNNYDGIKSAIDEVDKRLADLRLLKITPRLNKTELEAERKKLLAKLAEAKVTVKYNEDKAGYDKVLARIREIQRQKLEKAVTFKTDDASLEAMALDMETRLAGLEKKAKITLKVNTDTHDLNTAIAQVDAALKDLGKVELDLELNEAELIAKRAELEAALTNSSFKIEIDTTDPSDLAKKRAEVQKMLDSFKPKLDMEIQNNPDSLRQALYEIDKAKRDAEKNRIKLEVESTGLGLMAARLAVASRPRTVPFYIRINEKSLLVAEGILKSLSGSNTLTSLGRQFENIFTNFDTYSLKAAGLGTALGSVIDALSYVGTTMFSIGEGVSQSIGLLAMAPALLTTMAAGIFIYTAAFNNFSNAFSEDAKKRNQAMKELPVNARKAVDSLRGLYKQIATPVQNAFWETMGTSLQDAINHLIPQVKDGLIGMASGAGKFTAGILDSFTEIAQNKQLTKMFDNITLFFDKTGQAAKPFFDGFNQFGIRGSEFLPKFGDWILKMSNRFDDWATKSANNGDITRWIEEGVQSLKDMWNVGGSVVRMFQGITKAALTAGGSTLTEFSENLSNMADVMNGEPFQSRFAIILHGAREGASRLNEGFGDLTETLGRSSVWLGAVLTQLGQLGGAFLTNVSITLDSPDLQSGIGAALGGIEEMVTGLKPSFESLGRIIGGLGVIADSVFSGMAPLINTVMGYIDQIVTTLGGNLADAATALIEGLTGRVTALAVPIGVVVNLLNGVLGFFNSLPEGLQEVVIAAGIFLLLRGQLSQMLTAIGNSKPFTTMRDNWRMAESAAGRYGTIHERQFRLTQAIWEGTGRQVGNLRTSWSGFTSQVGAANGIAERSRVVWTTAFGGIKTALGGVKDFMGGWLGLAAAAVTIVGSVIGEKMAAAKAKVDNLVGSLDKVTGAATAASLEVIAKDWMQLDDDGIDAFWRGAKNASDAVKLLGIDSEATTKAIASGGPEYDKMITKLQLIKDTLAAGEGEGAYLDTSIMSMGELSEATGIAEDKLRQMSAADMGNLIGQIKGGREAVEIAEEKVRALAEATGLGVGTAGELAVAIENFGKKGATAAEQISAIKTQLDVLKGGKLTADEAARAFAKSWETALGSIAKARETTDANGNVVKKSLDYLVDAKGKIKEFSGAGGELYDATSQIADAQLGMADATYRTVLAQTGDIDAATKAAVRSLELTPAQLDAFAASVGISTEKAKALLGNFFGEKWEMQAMFSGNSALFFEEKRKAEEAGKVFDQAAWEAILKAKDETEGGLNSAREGAKAYSMGDYTAELLALPEPALAMIAKAVGAGDGYKRGDYSGILKAIDGTNPGVLKALQGIARVTDGNYTAAIKAYLDELSRQQTDRDLAALAAKQRTAMIRVFFGKPENDIPESIRAPKAADGAFLKSVTNMQQLLTGAFPMKQVKAFANGGIENHVAQIARPSSVYRVWAEPETGGEAYIPLSVSKRNRSTQILEQVARQFGYQLTRPQTFADGGVVGAGSRERSGHSVAVNIDSYIQQSENTADDVARAIMRRVKSRGVYAPLEGF